LAARQREALTAAQSGAVAVEWLSAWPDAITGVVLANEVIDAIPVRLLSRQGDVTWERHVTVDATGQLNGIDLENPPTSEPHRVALERLPDIGQTYLSEWSQRGEAWVASIAERLTNGIAIFIDYGFAAREYYHPARTMGTLMCHYRHRAHPDPLTLMGLQDITSHVDFSAMARSAVAAGARILHFGTQSQFLLAGGILAALNDLTPGTVPYVQASAGLHRLLSPAEMGDLFKVMVIGRGDAALAFDAHAHRMMAL
jgi:SAM-dependent MidA family methyltransferase